MKVVILAGGFGTKFQRIRVKPKPMMKSADFDAPLARHALIICMPNLSPRECKRRKSSGADCKALPVAAVVLRGSQERPFSL